MKAADATYFHGTPLRRAAESLGRGEPLRPNRPKHPLQPITPVGPEYAPAVAGLSYLSPSFAVACRWAALTRREDWPELRQNDLASSAHVFAFDLSGVEVLSVDEEELGWGAIAACSAISRKSETDAHGRPVAGWWGARQIQNEVFGGTLSFDADLLARVADETWSTIGGSARAAEVLKGEAPATARQMAGIGRAMRDRISPDLAQRLIRAGIGVGISAQPKPLSAWRFPTDGTSRPETPGEARMVAGPWPAGFRPILAKPRIPGMAAKS